MSTNETLEGALDAHEREADALIRTIGSALKEAKKIKAAAASGQLRELRNAMEAVLRSCDQAGVKALEVREGWTFDEQSYFVSGGYAKEVLGLAAVEGVKVYESDDRILSYPAIVQISASDSSVVIDKKRDRSVRPSVLVRTLKALQSKPPKFKAEAFLESLAVAYDLLVAKAAAHDESVQKLTDVYAGFTMLPGSARDYTKQEFARDMYLLDQSGVVTAKDGRLLQLPASALTRGSAGITTVSRSGQEKVYAGISFSQETR